MRIRTADVIAIRNDRGMDGLSHVSFGGSDGTYFQMCRLSGESHLAAEIKERGIEDIYCEINDQGQATYGGIEKCNLTSTCFSISFHEAASRELGDREVNAELRVTVDVIRGLSDALTCIFRGTGVFQDRSDVE
jgi:hypothetical protein